MSKSIFRLCQTYLLLVLLVAAILASLPYSLFALILLLVMLFITFHPLPPRLNMVITVAAIFVLPLVLAPLLHYLTYTTPLPPIVLQFVAVIAVLPAIYLLDCNLRQNAPSMTPAHNIKGRYITAISKSLFISTLALLLISFLLDNRILLFTTIIFALYLLVILIWILYAVSRLPLDVPTVWKRVIAGTTAEISLYATSKASIRLHGRLSPVDSWVKVVSPRFTLDRAEIQLNLTITPSLAGPSSPQLQASFIDPWGFIQVNQVIEPVALHVIPRARYAEWLALRYLEQAGVGTTGTATTTVPPKAILIPKGGVEYFDSRPYQPGDRMRDIDWKHTLKSSQLIIKEYIEAGQQAAIIAVNLSVTDAEEADKLAFNLITTALTLAREAIPTALAVYNHQKVVLTTPVIDPRETLKQTLSLVKDIASVEFAQRFLQPPDIGKLRRNITLLKQVTSQPAQRLLGMLNFEYRAIEEAARNHPATLALLAVTEHTPPPAIIVLVSQLNHEAEALMVTIEKLSNRGFTTIPMAAAKRQRLDEVTAKTAFVG